VYYFIVIVEFSFVISDIDKIRFIQRQYREFSVHYSTHGIAKTPYIPVYNVLRTIMSCNVLCTIMSCVQYIGYNNVLCAIRCVILSCVQYCRVCNTLCTILLCAKEAVSNRFVGKLSFLHIKHVIIILETNFSWLNWQILHLLRCD